jgi:hypothetical protein
MAKMLPVLVVLVACSAVAQTADVGAKLSSRLIPKKNHTRCASTPSQTYPCLEDATIGGIRYTTVGYDEHTRRIEYLLTHDQSFRTKNGLRVGSVIELREDDLMLVAGWDIRGRATDDGWRPIFGSILDGHVIRSADGVGVPVDLEKPVAGRKHRFKILALDKGGI